MGSIFSIAAPLAGGIGSLFGSSNAQNVQLPQMFQAPNLPQAANNAFSIPGQLSSLSPQALNTGQNLYNNPYAGGYQQGAGAASGLGQQAALNDFGAGNFLSGAGSQLIPFSQQIQQTAFDPQNALYNKLFQQNTDQTRAGLETRGVDSTPYGAGIENQSNQDFNLNWQNNLLGRQVQGAQASAGLTDSAGRAIAGGQTLQGAAPSAYLGASQMPFSAFNDIGAQQQNALTGSTQIPQQLFTDYLNYLGMGNNANQVANSQAQLALNQANSAFNQNQTLGSNFGAALQGLGSPQNQNFWNSMGLGYGGGGGLSTGSSLY